MTWLGLEIHIWQSAQHTNYGENSGIDRSQAECKIRWQTHRLFAGQCRVVSMCEQLLVTCEEAPRELGGHALRKQTNTNSHVWSSMFAACDSRWMPSADRRIIGRVFPQRPIGELLNGDLLYLAISHTDLCFYWLRATRRSNGLMEKYSCHSSNVDADSSETTDESNAVTAVECLRDFSEKTADSLIAQIFWYRFNGGWFSGDELIRFVNGPTVWWLF